MKDKVVIQISNGKNSKISIDEWHNVNFYVAVLVEEIDKRRRKKFRSSSLSWSSLQPSFTNPPFFVNLQACMCWIQPHSFKLEVVGNKGNWNKLNSSLFPSISVQTLLPKFTFQSNWVISYFHVELDRCWVVISWSEDLLGCKEALKKTEITGYCD